MAKYTSKYFQNWVDKISNTTHELVVSEKEAKEIRKAMLNAELPITLKHGMSTFDYSVCIRADVGGEVGTALIFPVATIFEETFHAESYLALTYHSPSDSYKLKIGEV